MKKSHPKKPSAPKQFRKAAISAKCTHKSLVGELHQANIVRGRKLVAKETAAFKRARKVARLAG